jgi:PAS domain-containing protein
MMKKRKQIKRKNMNSSMLNDSQLLQTLLENIPDHVYFKDRQSRFIKISRAHKRILCLEDQEEVFGKTDFDFFPRKYAQQIETEK